MLLPRSQPGPAAKRDLDDMWALLPADPERAAIVNAAAMELGALVCSSRSPRCDACPLAEICAWRAAGYPDTGDTRPKQSRFEGSDRRARGAVLRELRTSAPAPIPRDELLAAWPDAPQRDRAIASLLADGLMADTDGLIHLPGHG